MRTKDELLDEHDTFETLQHLEVLIDIRDVLVELLEMKKAEETNRVYGIKS